MEQQKWRACMETAVETLCRACHHVAKAVDRDEAGVKEIRELAAALKELSALRRSLEEGQAQDTAVYVTFDGDGAAWSE